MPCRVPVGADPILTVAQMRAAEQALIDSGTSVDELMRTAGRGAGFKSKTAKEALDAFAGKLKAANQTFQFGGDASTGLGFCTVTLNDQPAV